VPSEVLFGVYEARRKAHRPSLVYCRDQKRGKRVAAELIRDAEFDPVDVGPFMTMKLYTKIRSQNKRLAVSRLSYGKGVSGDDVKPAVAEK
jgi:predicted dinucleotide-binding enzyme